MIAGITRSQNAQQKQLPSVALGAGVLSFNGDVGQGLNFNSPNGTRTGYMLRVEQRVGKCLGIALNGIYGKLADGDNSGSHLNFESKITQGDLDLVFHFDNDFIIKRKASFAPYLLAGVGYLKFDPYGDLKDKNGALYHYWDDGTIRSLPQNDVHAAEAVRLQRDYKYETPLKDSLTSYSKNAIVVPVGVGVQLKLNDNIAINLAASYCITLTDRIDNVKTGKNDGYLYSHFSLQYTFGKSTDNNPAYNSVDFSSIDNTDNDGDGVKDIDDRCAGTPKGVKVDAFGCPQDNDGDGVPDYKDKELMTKRGEPVDENGITIGQTPVNVPDKEATKTNKIPNALRLADTNRDGVISEEELVSEIQSYIEDTSDFTVESLNDLISYYFTQEQ